MAKSLSVDNKVLYPYPNVMVIERRYQFLEGFDAKRTPVRLPKDTRIGWKYVGTAKEDHITIGKVGYWVLREMYIKKNYVYDLPKEKK